MHYFRLNPIGLNVAEANLAAIKSYRKIGFENLSIYEELMLRCQQF